MQTYYVDMVSQSNGCHEVHVSDCKLLPDSNDRIFLGEFQFCGDAIRWAKRFFIQSVGCSHCCSDCSQ